MKDLILPADEHAERAILGSCFQADRSLFLNVRSVLAQSDFTAEVCRRVFRALCRLYDAGTAMDRLEVYADLAAHQEPVTLSELAEMENADFALDSHVRRVRDLGRRRELIGQIWNLALKAGDTSQSLEDLVQSASGSLRKVYGDAGEAEGDITSIIAAAGGISGLMTPKIGIQTPWPELDRVTCGWNKGELTIIGARPSMGKTAAALNIAYHAAAVCGKKCTIYSYEMQQSALLMRLVSTLTGISYTELLRGEFTVTERRAIGEALAHLASIPLRIEYVPGWRVLAVRCHAEKLWHKGELDMGILDYAGLIPGDGSSNNRSHEVGENCRQLKQLAGDLRIPFLLLSQLNRASESRTDKRPTMADLRESGDLEAHADLIGLLHRPGYYDRDNPALRLSAEFIVAKQRNGDTPIIPLLFYREVGKFVTDGMGRD